MEIWKDLHGATDLYEVSNLGNFRTKARIDKLGHKRGVRQLILGAHKDGYKRVNVTINGRYQHVLAHRLVFLTFVGPIPDGYEINHKNGKRDDNRPENLEAISHADNVRYSRDVLKANYATYGNARMTMEQIKAVFMMRMNGHTFQAIGKALGFSKTHIRNVWHGKSWSFN